MALTVRRLRRLEAWSNWQAAGGTRQSVVDDAIAARASINIENEQLTVTLPLDSPAVPSLGTRKVIRIDQSDSRKNFIIQSQDLSSASWAKVVGGGGTAPAITVNAIAAPDGTLTADKVVFVAPISGDQSALVQDSAFTEVVGTKWAGSVYVKAFGAGDIGKTLLLRQVGRVAYTNVVLTANWQRVFSIEAASTVNGYFELGLRPSQGGSSGTVSAYVWGMQLEPGSAVTDYIPTTTGAVTVDAIFDEYRITERAVDDVQGVWSITASPFRLTDLAGCGLISRKDSDGVVVYDFEVLGQTPTELITNWVLPALTAAGFGWISIGNITPTARMDMTFAWDTPLSVLLRIASGAQSEIDLRKNGSAGYFIDIVSKINSSAQQADIRIDKNLINVTRVESSVDQATRVFPKGSAQDGMAGTMARARWQVTALTSRTNLANFSEQFGSWTQHSTTVTPNVVLGPDGNLTADQIAWAATGNYVTSQLNVSDPNGRTFIASAWLRVASGTKIVRIGVLRAGDLGISSGVTFKDVTIDSTWHRYDSGAILGNIASTSFYMYLQSNSDTVSIYAWGGDLDESSVLRPYVKSPGASNGVGTYVTLADPAGGAGPIAFNDQLQWEYLRRVDGSLAQISGSLVSTQQVIIEGNSGVAVNDLVEFRADSAGSDLTSLDNPAAIAAYGIKIAVREVADVPPTNNLIKNPVMRTWPGTLPTNWTAVNAPTTAKQTAAPFTVLGGASIKVTSTTDGQGVISDAVPIFPTVTNPYVSGFAKIWVASGNARVELVFTTGGGPVVWPVAPNVASATVLGQWLDLGASGFDANKIAATAVALRVVQQSTLASVFYVDAAQVTVTPAQMPFFEGSGAVRLWQEANDALVSGSIPVASYTVPLADLEAYDPATWSESALIIGANARIVDPRLSIDLVTRIVGIERDYIQPENISITLSNKPQDLTDILATTSRPDRTPGDSDAPLTNPQQPKIVASFDINGQLIINSFGDNDVTSQKIAWATGSAPSAATVRAATAINQQNISGLATGSIYVQGTTVFIAAFAYNARGFESSPLVVVSESRQGAIIDYTPFASTLAPIAILSSLPGTGAFVGQIVFLTTDKKLYRWDGASWLVAVAAVDITGQISTAQIADSAITALKIGALAVISGKIAVDAVSAAEIAALAVGSSELAAGAVIAGKITALTIVAADIAANTITAAKIVADTITASEIAANAITSSELAAGAVIAGKIAALTIVAGDIAALTITGAKIAAGTITADKLVANSITAGQIQAGAIGATEIAAGAITTAKIAAGAVTANEISANTITAGKIVAGTITTTELAPITVACSLRDTTTPTIATGTVNALSWNTSTYDPTGRQSGTSIICDASGGLVIILATIRWPSSNTLGTRHLGIYKNGSLLEELVATRSTYNAGEFWQSYTYYDWSPTSGDSYQIGPMQDSGSTIAVEAKRFTFIHLKI
jgi:hypothetical protein